MKSHPGRRHQPSPPKNLAELLILGNAGELSLTDFFAFSQAYAVVARRVGAIVPLKLGRRVLGRRALARASAAGVPPSLIVALLRSTRPGTVAGDLWGTLGADSIGAIRRFLRHVGSALHPASWRAQRSRVLKELDDGSARTPAQKLNECAEAVLWEARAERQHLLDALPVKRLTGAHIMRLLYRLVPIALLGENARRGVNARGVSFESLRGSACAQAEEQKTSWDGWEALETILPIVEVEPDAAIAEVDPDVLLATFLLQASPRTKALMTAHLELLQRDLTATLSDAARAVTPPMSPKTAHTLYDRLGAKVQSL